MNADQEPQPQSRPVLGYEGRYEVTDTGAVISLRYRGSTKPKPLSVKGTAAGYPTVSLHRDGRMERAYVHRLVADAFLGPKPPGAQVLHLNGIPTDNRLQNLAYGNRKGAAFHQASKTHCPAGHPYDQENTYRSARRPTKRQCRTCRRAERKRAYMKASVIRTDPKENTP